MHHYFASALVCLHLHGQHKLRTTFSKHCNPLYVSCLQGLSRIPTCRAIGTCQLCHAVITPVPRALRRRMTPSPKPVQGLAPAGFLLCTPVRPLTDFFKQRDRLS